MPMDGFLVRRIALELHERLIGGRVDRILQPERDEVHILIRCLGENVRLALCASADNPRAYLTNHNKKSMDTPPQFLMVLRKHLCPGRIVDVRQQGFDRVLTFDIESVDELGDKTTKHLVIEMMGRHSNIILVDEEGLILDSCRRVSAAMSRLRQVLPRLPYAPAPSQDKVDITTLSEEEVETCLREGFGQSFDKALATRFEGFSTQVAQEIAYRLFMTEKPAPDVWLPLCAQAAKDVLRFAKEYVSDSPACIYYDEEFARDVTAFTYQSRSRESQQGYDTACEAADSYYAQKQSRIRLAQKRETLIHTVAAALEKCEKKRAFQLERQEDTKNKETYRIYGELIMASVHLIPKGAKSCEVVDYYTDGMPQVTIALDEKLNATANAQRYFKLYNKAKSAQQLLDGQLAESGEELAYLQSVLQALDTMTEEDELDELRRELTDQGYIRERRTQNMKALKHEPSMPLSFTATDGTLIYVGKNNSQNDRLTFGANDDDIWLHAKDTPGSHVIVRVKPGAKVSDETLLYAARLAAKYSKAKNTSVAQVDYTLKKYVKKPSGAKPGFVNYTHQKTLFVEPLH